MVVGWRDVNGAEGGRKEARWIASMRDFYSKSMKEKMK